MRKYEISPAIAAAMRNRALAAPFREVAVPLYLELPRYAELRAPAFGEDEAERGVAADSFTIGNEDDDDFY